MSYYFILKASPHFPIHIYIKCEWHPAWRRVQTGTSCEWLIYYSERWTSNHRELNVGFKIITNILNHHIWRRTQQVSTLILSESKTVRTALLNLSGIVTIPSTPFRTSEARSLRRYPYLLLSRLSLLFLCHLISTYLGIYSWPFVDYLFSDYIYVVPRLCVPLCAKTTS